MTSYCNKEEQHPKMIITFTPDGDKVEFVNGERLSPARIRRSELSARRALKAVHAKCQQELREQERKDAEMKADLQKKAAEEKAKVNTEENDDVQAEA